MSPDPDLHLGRKYALNMMHDCHLTKEDRHMPLDFIRTLKDDSSPPQLCVADS